MKHLFAKVFTIMAILCLAPQANAQFNLKKLAGAAKKMGQALTLTDAQMAAYVKESVDWMDKNNPVADEKDPYTVRLRKLTKGITEADGIPLNFKVYKVTDVNAFACPDGSVRVFSALMDVMDDDELLGVIGHEIGHVTLLHSKNAFKTQLMTGALKDALSSTGGTIAKLTDSQLGTLTESLVNAKYSQKQETQADDSGYDFLVKNGKNPWGMAKAFEKLQSMEGGNSGNAIQKMFSSHPDTAKRIKHVSERAEKDGYTRP